MEKKGLGRGLESLFGVFDDSESTQPEVKETKVEPKVTVKTTTSTKDEDGVLEVDINHITPNPNQPRKNFDEEALNELASSIRIHGVIQPIVLNKEADGTYLIIAGERRWRASKLAGLQTVPAIIKTYTEKQVKEISIIENLQREDLNPIEAARAIKQLMEEYNFTQETVADRIGKSRPSIANTLRLLTLYPDVLAMVERGELSAGHARSLVVITDTTEQIRLAKAAAKGKMSVRELEKTVKKLTNPSAKKSATVEEQSLELRELISELQRVFATKVSAIGNDRKGRIYIDYYSRDDLDRIHDILEMVQKKELTLKDLQNYNKRNSNKNITV